MWKKILGLYLVFLVSFTTVNGATTSLTLSDSTKCKLHLKSYVKSGLLDAKDIIVAPVHWKAPQWTMAGGTVLLASLAYTQDVRINQFALDHKNEVAETIAYYTGEHWGRGIYPMAIMGGMFLYGTFSHKPKYQYIAMNGVKTFVLAALVVAVPKYSFQRHRPDENNPPQNNIFEGPFGNFHHTSFPSGHTTVAFAMSTFLAQEFKEKKWVAPVVYSLATLTAMQRVYDNRHWTSDVVVGAALGYGVAKVVCNKKNWDVAMVPYYDGARTQLGFSVSKQF